MCLTTCRKQPFVAQSDIEVFKYLENRNGRWVTPYQSIEVGTLPATLTPNETDWQDDFSGEGKPELGAGWIHALTCTSSHKPFKAIIPKGTEYFIDDDFGTVCAKKLLITDQQIEQDVDVSSIIVDDILAQIANATEIQPGDVFLKDLSIKHLADVENYDDIIAVVSLIRDNKAYGMALTEADLQWGDDYPTRNGGYIGCDNASNTYNGFEQTKAISEQPNVDKFTASMYCWKFQAYESDTTQWFHNSIGELRDIFRNNVLLVNITLATIKKRRPDVRLLNGWYWASSEYSSSYSWYCYTGSSLVNGWYGKWGSLYVRPALSVTID